MLALWHVASGFAREVKTPISVFDTVAAARATLRLGGRGAVVRVVQDSAHPPLGRIDFIPWVIFLIPFGFTGALRPQMLHVYGTAVAVVSISVFLLFVVVGHCAIRS